MNRTVFIDDQPGYIRAAIEEDGALCELLSENQADADQAESLFLGRVQSIRKSVNAAFVDIGSELNAFLPLDEAPPLRCGDLIIVQGTAKQATDTKGLRITTKVNLPGKWLVLVPGGKGVHVSKKIKDDALRMELTELGQQICPAECSIIIRTVSEGASFELLQEEADSLYACWQAIRKKASGMTRPGLLHQREKLAVRLGCDLSPVARMVTNSEASYEALLLAQREQQISPDTKIELFCESHQLLFDAYGIEPQIDKALKKRVWLPCGGYLVIEPCEALTVIDVNSGKMTLGRCIEDTALRVNLEAADEIARQIRLRDIGGIIIVDFIDMSQEACRAALLKRIKSAVQHDRSQVSIEGLTRLGLLEMTRRRIRSPLHKALRGSCSYCAGNGEVLSAQEVARRALRQVRRLIISGQRGPFVIRCGAGAAQALSVMKLPEGYAVFALALSGRHAERFEIEQIGAGISVPRDAVALK